MAKKNFIMLELDNEKTRKVANVVSNASCRKILDHLAEKDATESEIAKELGIPISTVHYNLQQLIETGLVVADEYHYSEKGKEMLHYRLANKYIIITPKKVTGIAQKLKSILPVALITAGAAGIIEIYNRYLASPAMGLQTAVAPRAFEAAKIASDEAAGAAPMLAQAPEAASDAANTVIQISPLWQNVALWFFIGALFALAIYFLISWIRKE